MNTVIVVEHHWDNIDDHETLCVTDNKDTAISEIMSHIRRREVDYSFADYTHYMKDGNEVYSKEDNWYTLVETEMRKGVVKKKVKEKISFTEYNIEKLADDIIKDKCYTVQKHYSPFNNMDEKEIDAVIKHMITDKEGENRYVQNLVVAIKFYRLMTNVSLKEAKYHVQDIRSELNKK